MRRSLFETALDAMTGVVSGVQEAQLEQPTPCADWNVRQLLNHIYYELAWVPELLGGKTIDQVGSAFDRDLVGKDFNRSWKMYAEAALMLALQATPDRVVHVSYGTIAARDYLEEVGVDLTVHAWDLARATGQEFAIDPIVAEKVYRLIKPKAAEWRNKQFIGPEIAVPESASFEARLLGLMGREP